MPTPIRKNVVQGWAEDGKIDPTKMMNVLEFAETLNDKQFSWLSMFMGDLPEMYKTETRKHFSGQGVDFDAAQRQNDLAKVASQHGKLKEQVDARGDFNADDSDQRAAYLKGVAGKHGKVKGG